jgi:hypothetical protein
MPFNLTLNYHYLLATTIKIFEGLGVTPVHGDLSSTVEVMAEGMASCDVVFHLASSIGVNITDDGISLQNKSIYILFLSFLFFFFSFFLRFIYASPVLTFWKRRKSGRMLEISFFLFFSSFYFYCRKLLYGGNRERGGFFYFFYFIIFPPLILPKAALYRDNVVGTEDVLEAAKKRAHAFISFFFSFSFFLFIFSFLFSFLFHFFFYFPL